MWQAIVALLAFAGIALFIDRMLSRLFDYVDENRDAQKVDMERPVHSCRVAVENPLFIQQAKELAVRLFPGCHYQFYTGTFEDVIYAFNAHKAEIAVILEREDIPLDDQYEEERLDAYGKIVDVDGVALSPLNFHERKLIVYSTGNHGEQ